MIAASFASSRRRPQPGIARLGVILALTCASFCLLVPAAGAALPRTKTLSNGWEVRDQANDPGAPQQAPLEVGPGGGEAPADTGPTRDPSQNFSFRGTRVPSVFDPHVRAQLYPGEVRRYRLRFKGPATPRGFRWRVSFESVRRSATVYLNRNRLGRNGDPYTPFAFEAKGLRPGRVNELLVVVDSRKNPRLPEGWWNWGGIVRPVSLVPVGPAYVEGLGAMPRVSCKGPARGCKASVLIDGTLQRRGSRAVSPVLDVRLRAPGGRTTRKRLKLGRLAGRSRRARGVLSVPAPQLWSPEDPRLYSATFTLRDRGRAVQVKRKRIGMRSVTVKRGALLVNNRRVALRGASIHEDMPGSGAALTSRDMDRIVSDLKELGANVTRAHYLLNERLLSRLDRAGIMVWNEAPVYQRDNRSAGLLQSASQLASAWRTVRRTVTAARSHPSVITHAVANELAFTPDLKPGTRRFLTGAARYARDLDPTIPISVDLKSYPGISEQSTYRHFDMLGINQYFGWYPGPDFNGLEPFLAEMRDIYPKHALVMTEFGAEGRPELAQAPPDRKGGYPFQAMHAGRTLDLVDRTPFLSGAIYWTLREFEIFPGWGGGAGKRPPEYEPNTRHQKGLLTYEGEKKPVWGVTRERFRRTPLYEAPSATQ